ncbi:hypothetical protein B0T21DRAFT_410733 [Apiosordaria backusii]|uniref:Arrestin-like N-terminal domain-containing protein n=1 Tax=Apiosordaria backusii TaxID=314023 RepID=A0AA40BN38_9PEZI|nr:hypothetical protein B0T21DRAFT_410733 [Apiosordaria backusii]
MVNLPWALQPTPVKASPGLSIHIHAPTADRNVFFPGETLTGQIRRQEHIVRPEVWLVLTLHGRSVARIEKQTGSGESQTTHHYNTQYSLFPPRQLTCINGSPIHIPPDDPQGQAWQFQLQIPSHCLSPRLVNETKDGKWWTRNPQSPDRAFIPLDSPQIPLPCSAWSQQGYGSSKQMTWVEYWLEAHLYDASPFNGYVKHVAKSRLPVVVYPMPLAGVQPIQMLRFWSENQVIRSQRLLAGREGDKLSFKEKMLKMVRSSRVPRLGFRVVADLPGGIQLGEMIGLRVGVFRLHELTGGLGDEDDDEKYPEEKKKGKMEQEAERRSAEDGLPQYEQGESSAQGESSTQEQPHGADNDVKIRLTSLKIKIKATTTVSVQGRMLTNYDTTKDTDIAKLELTAPALSLPGGDANGIGIPFISEESLSESRQPAEDAPPAYDSGKGKGKAKDNGKMMDLGALLGIRFNMKGFEICGNRYSVEQYRGGSWGLSKAGDLFPDFMTFNIKRDYSVVVKLGLEVVKEKVEVRFERKVNVLGATGYLRE